MKTKRRTENQRFAENFYAYAQHQVVEITKAHCSKLSNIQKDTEKSTKKYKTTTIRVQVPLIKQKKKNVTTVSDDFHVFVEFTLPDPNKQGNNFFHETRVTHELYLFK